jgi:hypothetical protein
MPWLTMMAPQKNPRELMRCQTQTGEPPPPPPPPLISSVLYTVREEKSEIQEQSHDLLASSCCPPAFLFFRHARFTCGEGCIPPCLRRHRRFFPAVPTTLSQRRRRRHFLRESVKRWPFHPALDDDDDCTSCLK